MKYLILGKLGGSFGGTELFDVVEAKDYEDASLQAWYLAKQSYQNYEGMNGLSTLDEFENNYKIKGDYE